MNLHPQAQLNHDLPTHKALTSRLLLQGRPQVCPHPGAGAAFRPESRGASVGVPGPGLPSHKGQDPQGSAPEGRSARATPPAGSCFPPRVGRRAPVSAGRVPSFPARHGRWAQAALRAGRARVRPEPESPLPSPHLSFPCRSTTSTKWQSASPRARREMRRDRRDGLGSLPPLHGARAGGGRRWGCVGVGTARPAAALPRPRPPGEPGSGGSRPGHAHCRLPRGEGQPRA